MGRTATLGPQPAGYIDLLKPEIPTSIPASDPQIVADHVPSSRRGSFKRRHRHSKSCDVALCCGPVVPLYERLFQPATVTTMEGKYTVTEFYCTLTSPCFALPLLIYAFIPFSSIPLLQHVCIAGSVMAGVVSTLYHCTLWKIFSSADAAVATWTFYLNAISLNRHAPSSHPVWQLELTWLLTTLCIIGLFVYHWERTHHISITLVVACIPSAVFGFYALESYVGLAAGVAGIFCFVIDRKGWACLHSVWHVLGGISLLWGIWDACLIAVARRQGVRIDGVNDVVVVMDETILS
ncbi:hypothetical protein SpCBS45565_g01965 [Spizellomyces sp. 'palustris']|nr:hypothetical protein SpCBS45565_g01965 [Spizellomyces sp. 'palustris']